MRKRLLECGVVAVALSGYLVGQASTEPHSIIPKTSQAQAAFVVEPPPKEAFAAFQDPRQACSTYYPLPQNYPNWHCGPPGYGSPCGGPQQCKCYDQHESLVTYTCQEGTYYVCENSPHCH